MKAAQLWLIRDKALEKEGFGGRLDSTIIITDRQSGSIIHIFHTNYLSPQTHHHHPCSEKSHGSDQLYGFPPIFVLWTKIYIRQALILKSSFFVHWGPGRSSTLSHKTENNKVNTSVLALWYFWTRWWKDCLRRGNSITRGCIPRPRRWRGPFVILSIVILSSH